VRELAAQGADEAVNVRTLDIMAMPFDLDAGRYTNNTRVANHVSACVKPTIAYIPGYKDVLQANKHE
jgi:hypothetical protein